MEKQIKKFRKRPSVSKIKKQAELRGHLTCGEETMLKGLTVKNSLQRIYNRAFDDSFNKTECVNIRKAMENFNIVINDIINKKEN